LLHLVVCIIHRQIYDRSNWIYDASVIQ